MNKYILYGVRKSASEQYGYGGIAVVCEDHLRRALQGYIDNLGGRIFDAKDLPAGEKYECEECLDDEAHYNPHAQRHGYLGETQRAELAAELRRLTTGNEIVRVQRIAFRSAEGLAWVVAVIGGFELVDHLLPYIAPNSKIGALVLAFAAFLVSRVFKRWLVSGRRSKDSYLERMFPGMTDSELRRLWPFRRK
jgi:hypothetical protein